MSLIADALKTAQREKSRRESSGGGPSGAAVLVPLRSEPQGGSSRKRILILSLGGLVAASGAAMLVMRNQDIPLPAAPAVTSTILSDAIAEDSANRARVPTPPANPTTRGSARAAANPPRRAERAIPRVAAAAATPVKTDTATVLQGQPSANAPPASAPAPEARSGGRLRIAVEQPRQPEASRLFSEAVAAHRAGDFPTARSLYERVLVLAPSDADALNNLGVLLSAQREFDRSLALLRRAASIAPRNAGVWNNIGTALREQGKNSDAIAAYRHALTIEPNHQGATVGLAQQYFAIRALPQAKELLEAVLATNPALAEAQYTLGQVLEHQGDRAGAVRAYTAFINAAPAPLAGYVEAVRRRVDALSRAP